MADSRETTTPLRSVAVRQSASAASPFWRWLIRIRAYFLKEVHEIRRQPLLILSLVGGPLLVLVIFGVSFVNSTPILRTAIVVPPDGISGVDLDQLQILAGLNFEILEVTEDRERAEALLRAGELDVVQVLPADIFGAIQRGEAPAIEFLSNEINPTVEAWIQYLGYAEVTEINKAILTQQATRAQTEAGRVQLRLGDVRIEIDALLEQITPEQIDQARSALRTLGSALGRLLEVAPDQEQLARTSPELARLRADLEQLYAGVTTIEPLLSDPRNVEGRREELQELRLEIGTIEGRLSLFNALPAERIVSPLQQSYVNLRGSAYEAVIFYAPGVLALLIQHTAITLGALALVRERMLGAFEVFRVAPVSMIQLLLGKYLGYTLFIDIAAAVLFIALQLLGIPLFGDPLQFIGLIVLLTVASLGVGFLISTVAGSDSQAIQLAMITLLLSIFFSGFFIGLDSFARPTLALSYSIPMTHGVAGFRDLMLRGLAPDLLVWTALAMISSISFILVVMLTRRQLRNP